jgi:hypothetical protein
MNNGGKKSKNICKINGVLYYQRWTILDVEAESVQAVKDYAKRHKVTTGRALEELVRKAMAGQSIPS